MKKYILTLLLFAITLLIGNNTQKIKALYADLNRDGINEKISWRKFATTEWGDYYQLLVLNKRGKIIWKGPKTKDETNPFFVASLHMGVSLPELVADIDQDKHLELLIPTPASDVSPLFYNRLKWKNGKFIPMKRAVLQYNPKNRQLPLKWVSRYHGYYGSWAMVFEKRRKKVKVSIVSMAENSEKYGEAYIRFVKGGAKILSWIEPLHTTNYQEGIFYTARLSKKDHYNSKGKRLQTITEILQQDRVNFHNHKRDKEDSDNHYFNSTKKRAKLAHYKIVPIGTSMKKLKKVILSQTPLVHVEIGDNSIYLKILK